MRPASASDPDGSDSWRYRNLAEVDSDLARRLVSEYGKVWVPSAELPHERLNDVGDTLEIVVADEWEGEEPGSKRLRLTSWYTGSTYWFPEWDGDMQAAVAWIRHVAQLQASNVRTQRFRYGPTPWDSEGDDRREAVSPEEYRAWLREDVSRHPWHQ